MKFLSFAVLSLFFCCSSQAEVVAVKKPWSFKTTLGANFNLGFNRHFIGSSEGTNISPSLQIEEFIRYYSLPHEWRTEATLTEGANFAPPPIAFIKSNDMLHVKTIYLYHWRPEWGGFGALKARTSLFPGYDFETSQYPYKDFSNPSIVYGNGTEWNKYTYAFLLTKPFLPLFLDQEIGAFYQPFHDDNLLLEVRAGATARQNIADGQMVIIPTQNDNRTSNFYYAVTKLQNMFEVGPSVDVTFKGKLYDNKVSYRLTGDAMYGAYTSSNNIGKISYDIAAGLGFNLLSWLSVNWHFKAIYAPSIVDTVQLMSNVMLAVTYSN